MSGYSLGELEILGADSRVREIMDLEDTDLEIKGLEVKGHRHGTAHQHMARLLQLCNSIICSALRV